MYCSNNMIEFLKEYNGTLTYKSNVWRLSIGQPPYRFVAIGVDISKLILEVLEQRKKSYAKTRASMEQATRLLGDIVCEDDV